MVERVFLSYEARGRIELRKTNGRNTGAGITVTSAVASEHVSLSWRFLARPCFFRAPGKHFLRYVKKISFFLHCRSKIEPLVFTSLFRIFDCNCKSKYQPPPLQLKRKILNTPSFTKKERNYLTLLTPFFLDCHNYSFYFNINLVEWLRETESRAVFQRSETWCYAIA